MCNAHFKPHRRIFRRDIKSYAFMTEMFTQSVLTELLTVAEVATILKTSKQQVRKMIWNELLPALMVGREYRISKVYLEGFIREAVG